MNRLGRVFPFLFLFVLGLALTDAVADEERNRVKIKWPSREFRDLQSAIDAAPQDAIIQIKEGVHQIDASLFVRGKRLVIKGEGSGRERARPNEPFTHLVGPPPRPVVDDRGNLVLRAEAVEGLWNFVAANVVIKAMKLSGFDAAIVSIPDDRGNSGPTEVNDVLITDTGRGILSLSSADLSVEDCTIMNTLWNGISFGPKFLNPGILANMTVKSTALTDPGGAGIYFENTLTAIDGVSVVGANGGGILGVASSSFIVNSFLVVNKKAGILLAGGFSQIEDNTIIATEALIGFLGDGISLWSLNQPMVAQMFNNFISGSDRAGVSAFGATAEFADNLILCSTFDIFAADWDGFTFSLDDLGGNLCGCGMLGVCAPKGEGLTPPPPIGGLE